jgi:hypothetical protein
MERARGAKTGKRRENNERDNYGSGVGLFLPSVGHIRAILLVEFNNHQTEV